jgi:hypothetical protein
LILTGQLSRQESLEKLKKSAYNKETIKDEFNYIAKKLGITSSELKEYQNMPKKFYWDYKNQERIFKIGAKVLQKLGLEKAIKR